ncbi:inactive dipeptidyl peptidase 10-like isoform X2 [Poeciliopsis prolifica]|uniref:inactive dipeptidyl peptidase 10-like isoform X2 n=1 Tax=Poeciliopsis prolifica TaxID=188132 RepID=UPI00241360CF|nr:inactive dipeptidyl peptidase 10-like isoform X2 [Poeciliopsis prolifica]
MNQSAGAAQQTRSFSLDEKDIGPIGPDRNWKGIGISLLVIMAVLSCIGVSIVLLSPDGSGKPLIAPLALDDLFQRSFQIHDPQAKWISAQEVVYRGWNGDVFKLDVYSDETELLLKNSTFAMFKATKFAVSPDKKFVLLGYDVQPVYKHSFLASFLIYDLSTREVWELNPPEVSDSVLQFASWGVQGQQLLYVFENNIYYQATSRSFSWRLTSSGEEAAIFNGIADWLYEEEVLDSPVAHWWSPDGSRLAYLTINDSLVPSMMLPRFTGSLYPRGMEYPYPKMGQINPSVSLHVVSLDGSSTSTQIRPPDSLENSDFYVTMVKWVTRQNLSVRWVNRAQNMSILSLCDASSGACMTKHVMTSEAWLDRQNQDPLFSRDCSTFFITAAQRDDGDGVFSHIVMISSQSDGEKVKVQQLTSGSWDVSEVLSYDENSRSVYFLSSEEGSTQQHLYRLSVRNGFHKECLSCSLFRPECNFYQAAIAPDNQHVLLSCTGPGIPQTSVHRLDDLSKFTTLERNAELRRVLTNRTVPRTDRRTIQINNSGLVLELLVPSDLDESTEHPLLLLLDSAPGGRVVSERFSLGWESVLVSSDGVVVARVDGRGSAGRGQDVLQAIYQNLGQVDVQDQIAALRRLMKLPYIDRSRVGVYGKAYGGFLSSVLLLTFSSVIKCGVAVAPVTNWKLCGSAGSERFFGFPVKADLNYQLSSLIRDSSGPGPRDFLIVHGTADASVHFQHSAELIQLLSARNFNYTLQIFPDEGHHLVGVKSQRYFLTSLLSFFRRCFEEEAAVAMETSKEDD